MEIRQQLEKLNQCVRSIDAVYRAAADRFGLSDSVFWILLALSEEGRPLTQQELCALCFSSKQTVHSAVQKLRREGYVTLEETHSVHGGKLVGLTDTGRALAEDTVLRLSRADLAAFSRMEEAERAAFLALHEKYLSLLRAEAERM